MGLLAMLLTMPLAPVRGVLWLAGHIQEQAAAAADPVAAIHRELAAAEAAFEAGEITEEECADRQDALLEQLIDLPGQAGYEGVPR